MSLWSYDMFGVRLCCHIYCHHRVTINDSNWAVLSAVDLPGCPLLMWCRQPMARDGNRAFRVKVWVTICPIYVPFSKESWKQTLLELLEIFVFILTVGLHWRHSPHYTIDAINCNVSLNLAFCMMSPWMQVQMKDKVANF